ncbi:sec-independent translocase [Streptomyces sp. NBC_00876]|uniref:sec-independent translocase n=1 Tax=Streptomyces sp. NBC_00876 TaxID=2975853 RepID=UPI0038675A28|nr:sec-independent translocase [Streptomyces sp. NBC_00876]
MFNDIGPLELVALAILGVLVFGPDKLPKVIQDASRFIRKIREFSESAKEDIRSELGPEFKDFDFEDLNPKTFVRKQLMDGNDDLGLKEIRESFDLRKEVAEVTDAVNGRETKSVEAGSGVSDSSALAAANGSAGTPDLLKKRETPVKEAPVPFDADAT